jgi:hypothetical protein
MRNSDSGSAPAGAGGNEGKRYSTTAWARLYQEPQEEDQAEALLQQALALQERSLGPEHPTVAITLTKLMFLYRRQGKQSEAVAAATRATDILAAQARRQQTDEPALPSKADGSETTPSAPLAPPASVIELSDLIIDAEYRPSLPETDPALAGLQKPEGDGWQPRWWKLGRQARWQYG